MEPIIIISSILRVLLVASIYVLNIYALIKLAWQPKACVHSLTTGAALLCSLLYLSSWAPYLTYGLANGQWLLLTAKSHCVLQRFVTMEISSILLGILAIRMLYRYLIRVHGKPISGARAASLISCLAWIGPQILFDIVGLVKEEPQNGLESYRFLDDLLVMPDRANATKGYRVGFMICMQALSPSVISYYTWQYLVLIVPLAGLIGYCGIRIYFAKRGQCLSVPRDDAGIGNGYLERMMCVNSCCRECKQDTFVDMSLYYNFIWMVLLRPLAILHALYLQPKNGENAYYMDFGTHLALAFASVFSPLSPRFGICQPFRRERTKLQTEEKVPWCLAIEAKKANLELTSLKGAEKGESTC